MASSGDIRSLRGAALSMVSEEESELPMNIRLNPKSASMPAASSKSSARERALGRRATVTALELKDFAWKDAMGPMTSIFMPMSSPLMFRNPGAFRRASTAMGVQSLLSESMKESLLEDENESKLNEFDTTMTIVNTVVGVIILSLPYAMHLSGFSGVFLLIAVTSVMGYTAHLIGAELAMLDELAEEMSIPVDHRDLGWIAFSAFGNAGRTIVSFLFGAELYLGALSFVLMSSINVQLLLGLELPIAIACCGACCAALQVFLAVDPERCMQLLAFASKISVSSLVVTGVGLIVSGLFSRSLVGPVPIDYEFISPGVGQALGTMLFMFAGHPCFPQIYYAMRDPGTSFEPAVVKAFSIAGVIYMVVGLSGYLLYAGAIEQSFMANLGVATDGTVISSLSWLRIFCQVSMTIKIIGVYPLISEPALGTMLSGSQYSTKARVLQRVVFATVTTCLAYALRKDLNTIGALGGGILTMSTSVLVPCSCFLKLTYNGEMAKLDLFSCIICLIFGVVGLCFCTCTSVSTLLRL